MRMKELYETLTGKEPKAFSESKPKQEHDPIQYSDQTRCRKCGKVWDTNDADPPPCE